MSAKQFGKRLKQAREAIGLSLRALSERIELSHTAIQKYEKGESFPSSDNLVKLAAAIQVPVERLFRPETVKIGEIKFRKKSLYVSNHKRKSNIKLKIS